MRAQQLFDGTCQGLLQRPHPRRVPAAYVRQALNVAWIGGVRRQRPALRPFQANACSGTIIGTGSHVMASGQRHYLAAAGTDIQRIIPYGDPVTLALTSLPVADQTRSAATLVQFLSVSGGANLTFIYDGVNQNVKYDGTSLTKMGLTAGTTPNAGAVAAVGGSLTDGVRKYVMTFESSSGLHEGPPTPFASAATVTFAAGTATQMVTIGSPQQGVDYDDPQIGTWKLWRTEDLGEVYYFVSEATIGTDIDDTIPDDELTGANRRPLQEFVNDEPFGPFTVLFEHRGQLIGVTADDESLLRYSYFDPEFMVPEGWPRNWTTPISHGDGDTITAGASHGEVAVVWKHNSCWALTGSWPDIKVQAIFVAGRTPRQSIGCPSQLAVKQLENLLVFRARDGWYALRDSADGVTAARLSNAIDDLTGAMDEAAIGATLYDRTHRTMIGLGRGKA